MEEKTEFQSRKQTFEIGLLLLYVLEYDVSS